MLPKDLKAHDVLMVLSGLGSGLFASQVVGTLTGGWFWPTVACGGGAAIGSMVWDTIMRPEK
jgi:hypothetical protein